jgi:hypothetical protein
VLAFQFAWGVFALRRDQRPLLAWTGLHAIVAALFVPQLRVLAQQAARLGADHWVRPPAPEDALNLLRQVSFGANYLIPLVLALALLPLLRGARRREAALLALTTLPVIALCYALSMSRGGLFVERYMYFALPGLLILAAAGIARLAELPGVAHRTLAFVRAAVLVALLALGLRSLLLKPVHEEARQLELAARWLDAHASRADLVLHSETHGLFYFRHYRPALGQHVVLMTRERIPYYDGDLLIPDAWRWPLESPIPGARWWGVVNGTSGIDVREARAWIAQGREPLARFGRVEIWAGAGSPNDSTECSAR